MIKARTGLVACAFLVTGLLSVGGSALAADLPLIEIPETDLVEIATVDDPPRGPIRVAPVLIRRTDGEITEIRALERVLPLHSFFLNYHTNARVTFAYGLALFRYEDGVVVELEPGLGGGEASIGYSRLTGASLLGYHIVSIKATAARTWWLSNGYEPGQTFLGLEGDAKFGVLNLGMGLLKRVVGSAEYESWMLTATVGLGFSRVFYKD